MEYYLQLHNTEDTEMNREIIYYDKKEIIHDVFYDDDTEMLHALINLMVKGYKIDLIAYPCVRCISFRKVNDDV